MIYFHGTERIRVEHTHRTDGFFFSFIGVVEFTRRPKVETLKILQHRSRQEACAFKTLGVRNITKNTITRIKEKKIIYRHFDWKFDRCDPSVFNARENRRKLRSSM